MATVDNNVIVDSINLIDVVAARGAFKGDEMLAVGHIRQALVNSVEVQAADEEATSEESSVEPEQTQVLEG